MNRPKRTVFASLGWFEIPTDDITRAKKALRPTVRVEDQSAARFADE